MLVDKTNFGLVLYKHANFYWFEETSSYWLVKRISVFLCFSLVNQQHISRITVYNRTVTKIENTVRAVHSCIHAAIAGLSFEFLPFFVQNFCFSGIYIRGRLNCSKMKGQDPAYHMLCSTWPSNNLLPSLLKRRKYLYH